jgi:hypothetical protein
MIDFFIKAFMVFAFAELFLFTLYEILTSVKWEFHHTVRYPTKPVEDDKVRAAEWAQLERERRKAASALEI